MVIFGGPLDQEQISSNNWRRDQTPAAARIVQHREIDALSSRPFEQDGTERFANATAAFGNSAANRRLRSAPKLAASDGGMPSGDLTGGVERAGCQFFADIGELLQHSLADIEKSAGRPRVNVTTASEAVKSGLRGSTPAC